MAGGQKGCGQRGDASRSLPAEAQVPPEGPVTAGSPQSQSKKPLGLPVGLRHPQTHPRIPLCSPPSFWRPGNFQSGLGVWSLDLMLPRLSPHTALCIGLVKARGSCGLAAVKGLRSSRARELRAPADPLSIHLRVQERQTDSESPLTVRRLPDKASAQGCLGNPQGPPDL